MSAEQRELPERLLAHARDCARAADMTTDIVLSKEQLDDMAAAMRNAAYYVAQSSAQDGGGEDDVLAAAREVLDTEIGLMACVGSDAPEEHAMGLLRRAVSEALKRRGQAAAEQPAKVERCTCPSGDGSLRWPCPSHPQPSDPADAEVWWREPAPGTRFLPEIDVRFDGVNTADWSRELVRKPSPAQRPEGDAFAREYLLRGQLDLVRKQFDHALDDVNARLERALEEARAALSTPPSADGDPVVWRWRAAPYRWAYASAEDPWHPEEAQPLYKHPSAEPQAGVVDWKGMYRFQTAMRFMDNIKTLTKGRAYEMADQDIASLETFPIAPATGEGDK